MSAQHDVNLLLIDWDNLLTEYARATVEAATAEAEHKRLRARAMVTEKHRDPKAALALCEVLAESDPDVATALRQRLITAATVEGMRGKLAWFRSNADAKRSEIASERANAALYSQGATP
jgi:hypothetical protein